MPITVWSTIIYEKGSWILHMLRRRLGDAAFLKLQQKILREYRDKPIGNDEFRMLASELVPRDEPDRSLSAFSIPGLMERAYRN